MRMMIWQEKQTKDAVPRDIRRSFIYRANAGPRPGSIPSKGRDTWRIVLPVVLLLSSKMRIYWSGSDTGALFARINQNESPVPEVIPAGV